MYLCPNCGDDNLAVEYVEHGEAYIDKNGDVGDSRGGDLEWSDDSGMRCIDCGFSATVEHFTDSEVA
jgi:hypothetical protein